MTGWFRKQPTASNTSPDSSSASQLKSPTSEEDLNARKDSHLGFCCRELSLDLPESIEEVGRDAEVSQLVAVLSCHNANSALLVGENGVGKTTVVKKLARMMAQDENHPTLNGHSIVEFSFTRASWCTDDHLGYVSLFRTALSRLERGQILYIPDFFRFLRRYAALHNGFSYFSEDLQAASDYYGRKRCIVEITPEQYKTLQSSSVQLGKCFQIVSVPSTSAVETIEILKLFRERYEAIHKVRYSMEAMDAIVRLVAEYSLGANPGAALNLLDRSAAAFAVQSYAHSFRELDPEQCAVIVRIDNELLEINEKKERAVDNQDFELACNLRNEYDRLKSTRWNTILASRSERDNLPLSIDLEFIQNIAVEMAAQT